MTIRKIAFRILSFVILVPLVGFIAIYLNYQFISFAVKDQIYTNSEDLSYSNYTLVFGTGNYRPDYWVNHGLLHRIKAVDEIIKQQKSNYIIVSGHRKNIDNDETEDMEIVLNDLGIPSSKLILDTLGIRTWVSVSNAKKIINGKSLIMVSQKEQLERAVFIANCTGVDAVGLRADAIPYKHRYWTIREYLSRVKCVIDCIKYKLNISIN